MKRYICILITLLTVCNLNANSFHLNKNQDRSPNRVEKKNFKGISTIKIDHSYGNIVVKESKSSGEVQLEVRYFDNKNRKVEKQVETRKNVLYVKTIDAKKNSSRGARIDYILTVPKKSALNVELSYGGIRIDNVVGKFDLKMEYGNLNANSLGNLVMKGKYNEITINTLNNLIISSDYSKVRINKANEIELKSKYTDYVIKLVKSVNKGSYSEFGDLRLDVVDLADVNLKYSDINIGKLNEKLKANCDYSDVNISSVSRKLVQVDIKSSFSDVKIVSNVVIITKIDLRTSFGEIDIANKFNQNYTYIKKESNKETRQGTLGKENPTASIAVTTAYGDIIIK